MDRFDFVIIGAGAAGEAAANAALERGKTVAVVERELFGGSCSFWACIPSKALLHAAAEHRCGTYPWQRASDRRDYMINREGRDWPDDSGHVKPLVVAKHGETSKLGSVPYHLELIKLNFLPPANPSWRGLFLGKSSSKNGKIIGRG